MEDTQPPTVDGASKSSTDNVMVQEAKPPEGVVQAVYRALVSSVKLPPLNDSEELREALLTFQPSSPPSERQEVDIVHREEKAEDKPPPSQHSLRAEGARKKPPAPSVLMLEALSRRRLDAVRQLHEVCPQLLASIPLFDHRSVSADAAPVKVEGRPSASSASQRPAVPVNYSHTTSPAHSTSTSVVLTPNVCHLQRSSRLLDLAAENQALLVFVLQYHPEVSKQKGLKCLGKKGASTKSVGERAQISKKCDGYYDSTGSAHNTCQHQVDPPHAQSTADSSPQGSFQQTSCETSGGVLGNGSENKDDDEKKNGGEENPLADLDPNSPVTICIRKNNAEVLQYLLFKHVWQHFLLDEVFNLPHNSYVPELLLEDLIHTCPDCPWFVHCAALMGCPQLLQLVLTGHFCQHQRQPFSPSTPSASWASSLGNEDTFRNARTGLQPLPEVHDETNLDHKAGNPPDSPELETAQKRREDTATKGTGPQMGEERPCPDKQNVVQNPTPSTSSNLPKNSPSCSYASQRPRGKACNTPEVQVVSSFTALTSAQFLPDPNATFPVSLPIMDRWISRCMHVRLTPLHLACWRCDPDSIKVLLSHGADVGVLADELSTPDSQREGGEAPGGGTTSTSTSLPTDPASAESSSVELNLNFLSVTVNSSSFDLGMEDVLKKEVQQGGLSALAMLALGIRSPPDFSLSIGKSLGLVRATLPEMWGGQVDRTCWTARRCLMEAMDLLLEAGCDVNVSSLVFGKAYRVMELLLQPSVDLYYAPLMPRGGRDSAVLRCMDLERVADIVLSACWELLSRGARLGPSFAASMEWNLFRMDWMFLQDGSLQGRFMHLAVFLGLFPPLDPALYMGSSLYRKTTSRPSSEESQSSVGQSLGGLDLREIHLPPYSSPPPPRPSCVPWAPSASRMSTFSQSLADSDGDGQQTQALVDLVRPFYSPSVAAATQAEAPLPQRHPPGPPTPPGVVTPPVSQCGLDTASTGLQSRKGSSSNPCLPASLVEGKPSEPRASGPSSVMRAQMIRWGLEERQRRCLEKFANEVVRLSMSPSCLTLLLHFLCLSDLNMLARITQHMLQTTTSSTENPVQRLHDAVCQAQMRTLQHACKQVILLATSWRPQAVHCLPLPECLRRYLLDRP